MDKVQTVHEYLESILRGTLTINQMMVHSMREEFISRLHRWNDLYNSQPNSPEFNKITNSLFSTILDWRSTREAFERGIGDMRTDERIASLEKEVNELKKDMKNVIKKVKDIDEKLAQVELSQDNKKIDAVT